MVMVTYDVRTLGQRRVKPFSFKSTAKVSKKSLNFGRHTWTSPQLISSNIKAKTPSIYGFLWQCSPVFLSSTAKILMKKLQQIKKMFEIYILRTHALLEFENEIHEFDYEIKSTQLMPVHFGGISIRKVNDVALPAF